MQDQLVTGQFNDSFEPIVDGVAIAVQNYARWLNQTLGPAYVITPAAPQHVDRFDFAVLRYFSVPVPPVHPYRMGFHHLDHDFWQALRATPFDLVHAHCPFTSGRLARRLARSRGIPLVATFHTKYRDNLERLTSSKPVIDRSLAFITDYYASADQVWVPNSATADTLREYGFRGPVEVVPNGSDMEASGAHRQALRERIDLALGLKPDEPVLLFVGQHVWEKNVGYLIRALELLQQRGTRFTMLFVGDGYAAEEMRALVRKAGLERQVRFLGLVRNRQRLQGLYARADLFLFPSLYDNAPLTVREAAAACLPAVLISGCTASEGIVDGENGFLVTGGPEQYARLVGALLADPARRLSAGLAAHETLFRSWQQIVGDVAQRYSDLVHEHAQHRTLYRPWPLRLRDWGGSRPTHMPRIPLPLLRTRKSEHTRWPRLWDTRNR